MEQGLAAAPPAAEGAARKATSASRRDPRRDRRPHVYRSRARRMLIEMIVTQQRLAELFGIQLCAPTR